VGGLFSFYLKNDAREAETKTPSAFQKSGQKAEKVLFSRYNSTKFLAIAILIQLFCAVYQHFPPFFPHFIL